MMNRMRRVAAALLAGALLLSGALTAGAASGQGGANTLEYSQIEKLVLANNLQVKNNSLTLENLEDAAGVSGGGSGSEELTKMLEQTIESMDSIIAGEDSSLDVRQTAMGTKVALTALKALTSQSSAGIPVDDSYAQLDLTDVQLDMANHQLIRSVQNLFTLCHQLEDNLQQLTISRESLEAGLRAAKVQLRLGLGNELTVLETETSLLELNNSIADLKAQETALKQQMNQLLGNRFDQELNLGALPAVDEKYLSAIDPKKDLDTAVKNSYAISVKKRERSMLSSGSDAAQRQRDAKTNEITMEEQSIGASLQKQYAAIQKQQSVISLAEKKTELSRLKWEQANKKYGIGVLSKMELENAGRDYKTQQAALQAEKNNLFWTVESYRWIVDGLQAG